MTQQEQTELLIRKFITEIKEPTNQQYKELAENINRIYNTTLIIDQRNTCECHTSDYWNKEKNICTNCDLPIFQINQDPWPERIKQIADASNKKWENAPTNNITSYQTKKEHSGENHTTSQDGEQANS